MLDFHKRYNAPVLWSSWRAEVTREHVGRSQEECG